MFASVGFPVVRLIRSQIGQFSIAQMQPADCLSLSFEEVQNALFVN